MTIFVLILVLLINVFFVVINLGIFNKHTRVVDAFYHNTQHLRNDMRLHAKAIKEFSLTIKSNYHEKECDHNS